MIILASKSPRRHELMKYITEDFIVKSADTDETLPKGISPEDAVLRLSAIKAEPFRSENDIIIGADTVVALGKKFWANRKTTRTQEECFARFQAKRTRFTQELQ